MENNNQTIKVGCSTSFVGLLQIAFIILKLCKVIEWHWLWVLAPTWITALLWIAIAIAVILFIRK